MPVFCVSIIWVSFILLGVFMGVYLKITNQEAFKFNG